MNTAIVLGVAQGIVRNHNNNLLALILMVGIFVWVSHGQKTYCLAWDVLKDGVVRQQRLQLVILKS